MATPRIHVLDTHTGGEPTRVVLSGGPPLAAGNAAQRRRQFHEHFDHYRSAIVQEPRGSDVMVGALIGEAQDPACAASVIFFNNVGYLGMCGHGAIGVAVALQHAGRLAAGLHRLETPVGVVGVEVLDAHRVTIENVPSYRYRTRVPVEVPGLGRLCGDVAWGGNWFFLVSDREFELAPARVEQLTAVAWEIRRALGEQGITGAAGAEIDHVELFGPPQGSGADSRNFVLCPGKAYDRSPCGTGTSAKLACLHADGRLQPGELWRQESIVGSVFEATYRLEGNYCVPQLTGSAYVTAEATLVLEADDPFCWGIRG